MKGYGPAATRPRHNIFDNRQVQFFPSYFLARFVLVKTEYSCILSAQSAARMPCEQMWAMVNNRFGFWKRKNMWLGAHWKLRMSAAIVTCFKLHNLCIDMGDVDEVVLDEKYFDDADHVVDEEEEFVNIRDAIAAYLETKYLWTGTTAALRPTGRGHQLSTLV